MPAINSPLILSKINTNLFNSGLYWIGVPVGANSSNVDPSPIRSSIGKGPGQRLHFKTYKEILLDVDTIIAKSVNTISGAKANYFNAFEYFTSLVDDSGIFRATENKPILSSFSISMAPNQPIAGVFSNIIMNPSSDALDLIEVMSEAEGRGSGTEVVVFANEELPVMSSSQFFPGVYDVSLTMSPELIELSRPGGVYGYYFGQPFSVDLRVSTYENYFESFREFFEDVSILRDINIGPFTVSKCKLRRYTSNVSTGTYKKIDINFAGKNIIYNPGV